MLLLALGIWYFQAQVDKKDKAISELHEASKSDLKESQQKFVHVIENSNEIHSKNTAIIERMLQNFDRVMPKLDAIHEDVKRSYKRD